MILLEEFRLKNIVYYENARVRLKSPLVVVRGLNKASFHANQNNGAGKSLLFFPVANILRGAPPIAAKKKGRKDILGKDSCATIRFITHGNKRVEVNQYEGKYEIIEDGKDLEIKSIPVAEKYIKDYFPLNDEEFYSTVYLRTAPLDFQVGTPSDRLNFISDLFRLDSYDALRKYFSAKLRDIKDDETRYATLSASLVKLEADLKELDWDAKQYATLQKRQAQLQELRDRVRAIGDRIHNIDTDVIHLESAIRIDTQLTQLGYVEGMSLRDRLDELKAIKEALHDYDSYETELRRYRITVADMKQQLDDIKLPKKSQDALDRARVELEDRIEALDDALSTHNRQHALYEDAHAERAELVEAFDALGIDPPDDDVEEELAQCRTTLSLRRLLEHEHEGDAKCPTCLSDIDIRAIRRNVEAAEKRAAKLTRIRKAQDLKRRIAAIQLPKYDAKRHEADKEARQQAVAQLRKVREGLDAHAEHDRLSASIEAVRKPKPVKPPKTEYDIEGVDDAINTVHRMMSLLKSRRLLDFDVPDDPARSLEKAKAALVRLKAEEAEQSEKFDRLSDSVRELEDRHSQFKVLNKGAIDIREQLAGLEASMARKSMVEALVAAYGPKGLKIQTIRNICAMLEANFNAYSKYIYNEDFSFRVVVEPTGIQATVNRNNSKFTSDIRTLSGAESDCFKLMFLNSLLPIMPSERRTNFVILDEPDSHMDPVSREKFINDFVPELTKIIPHVFIITPNDDAYNGAEEWLVIKDKNVSTLTKR